MCLPFLSGGFGVSRHVGAGGDAVLGLVPVHLVVPANSISMRRRMALVRRRLAVTAVVTASAVASAAWPGISASGPGRLRSVKVRVRHVINHVKIVCLCSWCCCGENGGIVDVVRRGGQFSW